MSSVRLESRVFELAEIGPENPLPDLANVSYVHSTAEWDASLNEDDTRYMRYGRVSTILPYMAQDGYTRNRKAVGKDVVILENEFVRAEFLPWMGGRLRSLVCNGREMLHVNPVIQPCNLALRNAWCSGGVEWNVSIRGHNMLTNEPLFVELLHLPDGTEGVRFYEYERIRGIVYRLEAYLPPESRFLFVQVHIENPQGNGEVPMYWWSNIAVPEKPGTRVIAPAETAILSLYDAGKYRMMRVPLPDFDGMDLSRPKEINRSLDVFYDVEQDATPFVAALQDDHTGLVQCSTARMRGRKLFVWGMGQGGRHWQNFLSNGREQYIEIQAGIAKTQQDHLPMAENTVWEWLEAYGSLTCDVDGLPYSQAIERCAHALEQEMNCAKLKDEFAGRGKALTEMHGDIVRMGSGWGALENLRRSREGLPAVSRICRFPAETLGTKQSSWRQLVENGSFPESLPLEIPVSYMTGAWWYRKLSDAPAHWAALYHLGVMVYAAGFPEKAGILFRDSIRRRENPWAWRALGRISVLGGEADSSLVYYQRALALLPDFLPLCLEYAQTLSRLEKHQELLSYLDSLDTSMSGKPRFEYLRAVADVALSRYEEAEAILNRPLIIPDMREGELSLCDLWFDLYQKKYAISRQEAEVRFPLPEALDFRMH